ncbi:MAG: hypothetical protein BGO29_14760 [Bacteroidales bacterium 36-12]|nr:MAG: hypothetical protein BGO29_14760 [Bacteroidales bacterium 36-12]
MAKKIITLENLQQFAGIVQAVTDEKVDKMTGKGLSENDFTNAYKNKVDGIADNANNYSLPDATESVKGGVLLASDSDLPGDPASNASKGASTKVARADHKHKLQTSVTGNAGTATKLSASKTINLTGDATGTVSTDFSTTPISIPVTLKNDVVTAGTKAKITYNSKGLVTGGADLNAGDIPQLTASKISDFNTTARDAARGLALHEFTAPSADVGWNSKKITNLGSPSLGTDAANKDYVDSARAGLQIKDPVKVATTANITLSGTQTIDGVAVAAGDRVLVKNQTTASANGIYVVATGAWARASDALNDMVKGGMAVWVNQGTTNGDSRYVLTTDDPITVGTTALTFTKDFQASDIVAGTGLTKSGNNISAQLPTKTEAEGGADNTKLMTPLRTKEAIDALSPVKSVAGKTGVVTLAKGDVGLGNVDNVSSTDAATANTIIKRDANGRAKVANGVAATDIANITNVNSIVNAMGSEKANKLTIRQFNVPYRWSDTGGEFNEPDTGKLVTDDPTPNTIAERSSEGKLRALNGEVGNELINAGQFNPIKTKVDDMTYATELEIAALAW